MRPFLYDRPETVEAAIAMVPGGGAPPPQAEAQFIAGGTNMLDYMKLGVMNPGLLVDLNGLDEPMLRRIGVDESGITFGALVHMADAEEHPVVKARFPVIAETLKLAASGQIRNMATLGGNVLQRTRCEYFREISWPCNKRHPGSGCAALDGFNRQHAVLGTSEACIATYHGDFAQSLIALGAVVAVTGPEGTRDVPFESLHLPPGDTPNVETVLRPDEIITAIRVPAGPWTARSHYLKLRDRQSYAFALAAAAVALDMDGDTVREARIALGGVATTPWRSHAAEDVLRGTPLTARAAEQAAEAAFAEAKPRRHNGFKVPLGKATLVRALLETRDMQVA